MATTRPTPSPLLWLGAAAVVAGIWVIYWNVQRDEDARNDETDPDNDDNSSNVPRKGKAPQHLKLPSHLERELAKEERRKQLMELFTMKKPMYDNIVMQDPDGNTLSTISIKKASWYVKKGLAVWLDEQDKKSIRLNFEPQSSKNKSGSAKDPRHAKYNQTPKLNVCVVCGEDKDYMRHYVVPYCYRSLLPPSYKTHLPHDVVLLCAKQCHMKAERSAHKRMRRMEQELRGVDRKKTEAPYIVDGRLHHLVSSAQALVQWKHKLPPSRIREYEELLQEYWVETKSAATTTDTPPSKEDWWLQVSQIDYRMPNPHFVSGPDLVVASLGSSSDDEAKITKFIHSWRRHFLETMKPRHLPTGWSVDSPVQCDRRGGG